MACAAGLSPTPARAGEAAATMPVVEMFTSQGCSSCPAADALFESYAARTDMLALSYSVDIWDQHGWRDTLASPRFTKRQRAYAKARGDGQIYTPQAIINGLTHAIGSNRDAIDEAVAGTGPRFKQAWTPVRLQVQQDKLLIDAPAAVSGIDGDATIWLLVVARRIDVAVKRGENAGKTLTYFNVVRDITPVGMWNGAATNLVIERQSFVPAKADMLAVILQQGMGGPILGCDVYRA